MAFAHTIRARYGEVDMQGVVFNAHWLTYFDDCATRFFDWLGFAPKETFVSGGGFDFMLVKALVEWKGSAGFDDEIRIDVAPARIGNSSFDLQYSSSVDGHPACDARVTYVLIEPGTSRSREIPAELRSKLEGSRPKTT
jgi:acyl-CoA thioester hydrolase